MVWGSEGAVRAFRIADRRFRVFDGFGSFLHGSRWTSEGKRVIHCAQTFAGALLESLVHSSIGILPHNFAWVDITIPAALIETIGTGTVPKWNTPDTRETRRFGDQWFQERRSAVLVVPSVVTGGIESNLLINQDHADFERISASEPREVPLDRRLFPG